MRKILLGLGGAILVFTLSRVQAHRDNIALEASAAPTEKPLPSPSPTLVKAPAGEPRHESTTSSTPINCLVSPGMVPATTLRNAGRNSARAALETEIYALGSGEVDLLASVITFNPDDEEKLQRLLAVTPLEIKNKYQTPERIVAFFLMGGQQMESLHVLTETPPRDDTVVELVEFKFFNDPTIRKDGMVCLRQPDGWKTVIPGDFLSRVTVVLTP